MARQKYIKDGNPDWFTFFNSETYDSMTEAQKIHWSPATDGIMEHIPDDVLNFMPNSNLPPLPIEDKAPEVLEKKAAPVEAVADVKELTQEQEKNLIKAELDKLGIRYAWNAGLENLKSKLDAHNSK
jgi:hypothetical protein